MKPLTNGPFLPAACLVSLLVLSALSLTAKAAESDSLDWPHWRGPEQNGISREINLVDELDPRSDNVLWRREDLGGRCTPIVMRGRLYTIMGAELDTPRQGEKVVCLDAATGEPIWENRFNVNLSDVPAERTGWASCIGDPTTGRVYALGVCGLFQCLDGQTGETIWSQPLHEKYGLLSTFGGRTNFPVVFEDMVIVSAVIIGWGDMARPTHRFLAFDKESGEIIWFAGTRPLPYDTTYSTPFLTVSNGQAAMVFGSGDGAVWAFQPRTGRPIWHYQFARRGLNSSPIVVEDRVYIGNTEENIDDTSMGAVVALDGTGSGDINPSGEIWRIKEVVAGKSSPLLVDGRLYVIDDKAGLWIFDSKSGEQIGRRAGRANMKLGTRMVASPLYADGKIYACTADGRWAVLKPTAEGVEEPIARGRFGRGEECNGSPIVSHGRIYVPTTGALYCFGKQGTTPQATPRPKPPAERPPNEDPTAAHVQVAPAEALLRPGEQQQFSVRLFNSRGQFLKQAEAEFLIEGTGQIDSTGLYSADADAAHVAATVTARVGELTASARVRIVPELPWKFDFSDGEVPITWVGARYRHVVRELDGDLVMVKITTIPKGTRSRAWMGLPDLHDYTIQADVRGAINDEKLPEIGLIAQGYALVMMGEAQELQIRSWAAQLRMARRVPLSWEPNVWYTMKLRAAVESDQAVLRGKVWPRGDPEPEEWTVEAVDETPNRSGSPGLFGNANDAEIYLDNIVVTPNSS